MRATRIPVAIFSAALLQASALLAAAPAAAAQMTPLAQARSIEGTYTYTSNYWLPTSNFFFPDFDPPDHSNHVPNGPLSFQASGFEPFGPKLLVVDLASAIDGHVEVRQTSTIDVHRIAASGSYEAELDAHAAVYTPPATMYNFAVIGSLMDTRSSFSTTFDVDERTAYHLTGELTQTPGDFPFLVYVVGTSEVRLLGPGGTTLHESTLSCSEGCAPGPALLSVPFSFHGVLSPGTYTIEASTDGEGSSFCLDVEGGLQCFQPSGTGSFALELSIPGQGVPLLDEAGHVVLSAMLLSLAWLFVRRTRPAGRLGNGLPPVRNRPRRGSRGLRGRRSALE